MKKENYTGLKVKGRLKDFNLTQVNGTVLVLRM